MTNYWADVDSNDGCQAHEFYLRDALYAVGNNRFEGKKKIRAFYAQRRQRGRTTTRHLVDILWVFRDDPRRARTVGVMSLYAPTAVRREDFRGGRQSTKFLNRAFLARYWKFESISL